MRIVIDMQGAQTNSLISVIGSFTLKFTEALIRNRGEHEIILVLNGLLSETIEAIRATFDGLLAQENIKVWHIPGPLKEVQSENALRTEVAEMVRESFLASLKPDVIHISSLFEGYLYDVVTSIGSFDTVTPVTVTLLAPPEFIDHINYDLWFKSKKNFLSKASACFVASECMDNNIVKDVSIDKITILTAKQKDQAYFDAFASQAFSKWAGICSSVTEHKFQNIPVKKKLRLAYISPLPPERTGIADYSAELLPALEEYYKIEVVVAQDTVSDSCVINNYPLRDASWLEENACNIDRVIYHVGNNNFHAHMIPLLKLVPGVVVLHDFFISDLMCWIDHHVEHGYWVRELYFNHGYLAVLSSYEDASACLRAFPCAFSVIGNSLGLILHSEYSRSLAKKFYQGSLWRDWSVIPHLRQPVTYIDRNAARKVLGLGKEEFVLCSFGFMDESKLNHRLLNCWLASALAHDRHCHLIFVGENPSNAYGAELLQIIRASNLGNRIRITGFVSTDEFRQYLMAADIAVQLRSQSRGETSGTVLDCMNYALPVIVNAHGSMAELDSNGAWMIPDEFDDATLIEAVETLWREPERRRLIGEKAFEIIRERHSPETCAKHYADVIEQSYRHREGTVTSLIQAIVVNREKLLSEPYLLELSKSVATNLPNLRPSKNLFLDITGTCQHDLKTGIQRVARGLLLGLLRIPPPGHHIEPIYLDKIDGEYRYRYARQYTLDLLGCPSQWLEDEFVEPECGDTLLVLDMSGEQLIEASRQGLFAYFRNKGVEVHSIIYDLIIVRKPEFFPTGLDEMYRQWFLAVSEFDGALCISKIVADDFASWQNELGFNWYNRRPFKLACFHLGADVSNSFPTQGLPDDAESIIALIKSRPSFLMVGTIEPRKGYMQVLEAFSQLWAEGMDVNLVIVGKEGWKGIADEMRRDLPRTILNLRNHAELGKRLHWLEDVSDEYLEKVYAASCCLIAASIDEGFGLPLIEAAQHKLPIIARDIPVFREVAGLHASYFQGMSADCVARAVIDWLGLYKSDQHLRSDDISWLTWQESAAMLTEQLFK